jgi:hypothetical protein
VSLRARPERLILYRLTRRLLVGADVLALQPSRFDDLENPGSLMLAGVALLGTITASLASWLVERVTDVNETEQAVTRRDVAVLTVEVMTLRAELKQRTR